MGEEAPFEKGTPSPMPPPSPELSITGGASESAVDTCCLISAVAIRKAPSSPNDCRWPVWNTVCLCGKVCRPCRSKNTHPAQRYQHGAVTEHRKMLRAAAAQARAGSAACVWHVFGPLARKVWVKDIASTGRPNRYPCMLSSPMASTSRCSSGCSTPSRQTLIFTW